MTKSVRTTAIVFLLSFVLTVGISPVHASFYDDVFGGSSVKTTAQKAGTAAVKPSPKPSPSPKVQKSSSPSILSEIGDALWPFDDGVSQKNESKASNGQVLGANDGPSFISKFFNGVWGAITAVADFLWPFDGDSDKGAKGDKGETGKSAALASPTPSPAPEELADTGELEVAEADDDSNVTVVLANELDELTVNGDTVLGDATSDLLTVNARLNSSVLPKETKVHDLGSGDLMYKGVYAQNVYLGGTTVGSAGITFEKDGTIGTKDGSGKSLQLDSDSGTLFLGPGTNLITNSDNSQAITIDPNGANQINFHSSSNFITSAGNMTIAGTLTTASGAAVSSDNLTLTPSTDIDALNLIGTNVMTADLIDLNADATTTGDGIDISMANTRTSGSAILITDASVAATVTGDLIQINVTGTPDTNTIDIDVSAAASGNMIDLTTTAVTYTGNYVDINIGSAAQTGDVFNTDIGALAVALQYEVVANAAISSTAGWLMDVDTSAAWTGNMVDITTGAQAWTGNMFDVNVGAAASTGDVFNVSMGSSNLLGGAFVIADAGGARTDALIDITSASTGSAADGAAIMQINSTGDLDDLANVLDINMSGGTNANVIDITTLTNATGGNMLDLNFGAVADTGDAINIAVGTTAVGAQALVVTDGTIKTADLISITASGATVASGIDLMSLAFTTGNGTDIRNSVVNIALTSGGTAATDLAQGILLDLVSTAGGFDTAIEIENTAAWDVDIALQFDEQIVNSTDDMVDFIGAAGSDNTDLRIDLDGTRPVLSSVTDTIIDIAEDVEISGGNLFLTLDNEAGRDFALCTAADDGGATPGTTLQEVDDCDANVTADYAERYPTDGSAQFGDVMVLGTKAVTLTTGEAIPQLVKSSSAYQRSLVGVVSANTHDFSSAGYNVPESENPQSVALVGRVPVKVTGEGGTIAEGDYLTTSSTPGYAMKATHAGPVVGMALSSFSGESGTVMVFVKAAWYDPVQEQKMAVLAALGLGGGSVLGVSTAAGTEDSEGSGTATSSLIGAAADGSLGVLEESVDLLVHGLLTANNLRVTTAAEFEGTLVVKGLATFEGDLVVKGAFSTGSLDLSGALTKTMTAGSDISAGDPVVISASNTVVRAGGSDANVVGLAASSASAGSSVRVAVAGTVGGYSGLAAGSRYYVGEGGSVTTSPGTGSAVHVGIAISGSEMIVQIFKASVEPVVVEDVATVDPGPEVTVDDGSTPPSGGETPAASPEPTSVSSPEPTVEPSAFPEPSPSPAQ